jgi:hypothetical protein
MGQGQFISSCIVDVIPSIDIQRVTQKGPVIKHILLPKKQR